MFLPFIIPTCTNRYCNLGCTRPWYAFIWSRKINDLVFLFNIPTDSGYTNINLGSVHVLGIAAGTSQVCSGGGQCRGEDSPHLCPRLQPKGTNIKTSVPYVPGLQPNGTKITKDVPYVSRLQQKGTN
jgi:hypothetical protein